MDELIIELLNMAEKHGILTGGTDDDGNAAYVVIDSSNMITVTVRPGGRATIIIGGEEENFDLSDEENETAIGDFMGSLVQALVEDNLDHKSSKLINLLEEFSNSLEEEGEDEEQTDDGEDEEEDSEEDETDSEDDETDSEDDEAIDEEEDPAPKKRGKLFGKKSKKADDEDTSDDDEEASLSQSELALMVEHADDIIKRMVETAGDEPEVFDADRFNQAVEEVGGLGDYTVELSEATMRVTVGDKFVAHQRPDFMVTAAAIFALLAKTATNEEAAHKMITLATKLGFNSSGTTEIASSVVGKTILAQLGGNKFISMTGAKNLVWLERGLQCDLPVRSTKNKANRLQIVLTTDDLYAMAFYKWDAKKLLMKPVGQHTSGLDAEGLRRTFTEQTGLEISLGTLGREQANDLDDVETVDAETADLNFHVEIAITQAKVREEVKKLKIIAVTINEGEYRVSFTKKIMPDEADREAKAAYTDDPEEAIAAAKSMANWYERQHNK